MKLIDSIIGTVNYKRSKDDDCVCCEGKHIYAQNIVITSYPSKIYAGLDVKDVSDFISEFVGINKNRLENKKVRVTIETVD